MTIGGSKATGVAVPAGFAPPPRRSAAAATHEYDLQSLLGDDVLAPPRKRAGAPAAGAAQAMFAPHIPFSFALDADSSLDFTGSFLTSASKAPAHAQVPTSNTATTTALEGFDEEMFDESGDEWLDGLEELEDIGDFDLNASESASSAGGMSGSSGVQKRKADGTTKRPRHRPTVLAVRQRQQTQLDKLNARNDELRESISDVTGQLDQVKRLLVQLLKRKASK